MSTVHFAVIVAPPKAGDCGETLTVSVRKPRSTPAAATNTVPPPAPPSTVTRKLRVSSELATLGFVAPVMVPMTASTPAVTRRLALLPLAA